MTRTQLYFSPQPTRSARARWAFTEVGGHYEAHAIDIFKGEQNTDAYRAVHPLGFVPAAKFDGEVIFESCAIALIVATEHPDGGLIGSPGTTAWRKALQWAMFAPAELDPILSTLNAHRLFRAPAERNEALVKEKTEAYRKREVVIVDALGDRPYLLGEDFSVADVCVGHDVAWAKMHDLIEAGSTLEAYLERLEQRPAFREIYGPRIGVFPDPYAQN